jgi:hypothetical protein
MIHDGFWFDMDAPWRVVIKYKSYGIVIIDRFSKLGSGIDTYNDGDISCLELWTASEVDLDESEIDYVINVHGHTECIITGVDCYGDT